MKKLTYLFVVLLAVTACSVESLDSAEGDFVTAEMKAKKDAGASEVSEYDYNNQGRLTNSGGNYKGDVFVSNDCDNLYIKIVPKGDAPEDAKLGLFTTAFPKENGTVSELQYNLENAVDLVWTFPLSDFDTSNPVHVFVNAWGTFAGEAAWGKQAAFFTYEFEDVICEEEEEELECEGTYMIGNETFRDLGIGNNWGWVHLFNAEDGMSQTFDLYNGAAQNDTDKGTVLGSVTINLNEDGTVSLTTADNITITHRYVADDEPVDSAPGQFDEIGNLGDKNGDGQFWVIIKADVCSE